MAAQAASEDHASRVASLEQVAHDHTNGGALASITDPGSGQVMTAAERTKLGGISIATTAQATAGAENTRTMTSLRTREAIDARASEQGYVRLRPFGTLAEATAATVKPGDLVVVGTGVGFVGLWLVTGATSFVFSTTAAAVILIASPSGL